MNPMMHRYTDEYLEYWGHVFATEDLYCRRGIRFDTFLLAPREILAAVAQLPADAEPLLPRQAEVMAAQLWAERGGHPRSGGPQQARSSRALGRLLDGLAELRTVPVADPAPEPVLPAAARLAGERYIEPMRHHCYAVSARAWDRRR